MGDRLHAGKPSRYVTSNTGQLSLAIPPWVGTPRDALVYPWSGSVNWGLAEG